MGRSAAVNENKKERRGDSCAWYSTPGLVPGVGPRHGHCATWVGAAADQTFLRIDESLINASTLKQSTLMANKSSISKYHNIVPTRLTLDENKTKCNFNNNFENYSKIL